jgi:fused signal recognition particle receptor
VRDLPFFSTEGWLNFMPAFLAQTEQGGGLGEIITIMAVVAFVLLVVAAVTVPILRKTKWFKALQKKAEKRRTETAKAQKPADSAGVTRKGKRKPALVDQEAEVEDIDWSDEAETAVEEPQAVMQPFVQLETRPSKASLIERGLSKTRKKLLTNLRSVFTGRQLDDEVIDEIRSSMLAADMGPHFTEEVIAHIKEKWHSKEITDYEHLEGYLKEYIKKDLRQWDLKVRWAERPPTVILVVGVNGSGKTTSIAKLAYQFKTEGKKVIVAAADTFRAAAVDQLTIWAERIGVEIVKHMQGADPAAVTYDAVDAAIARDADVIIVDTAGRLHTQKNLMQELDKIKRVITKKIPDAPHEVIMVLDATTGQNAISQAKLFTSVADVTSIFLAKLDGTAKGGVVIGMREEIDIPVKFVGLGETPEDIAPFDPDIFIDAMFE